MTSTAQRHCLKKLRIILLKYFGNWIYDNNRKNSKGGSIWDYRFQVMTGLRQ